MNCIRLWLSALSILFTLAWPNLVAAETCRLFLIKPLADAAPSLVKKGYQVQVTEQPATFSQMTALYDTGVAYDRLGHTGFWIKLSLDKYAVEVVYSQRADFSDLPDCSDLHNYASEADFNLEIGNLARTRLDSFYANSKLEPGLGDLILKSESLRIFNLDGAAAGYKKHEARYTQLVAEVKRIWEYFDDEAMLPRLERVRKFLYPIFSNYAADFHAMSLLLDDKGFGDCEANTQLILASLIDAGVKLDKGYTLGAQLYNDHIQPVLLTPDGKIYDLTTGGLSSLNGSVYSPEILTFAIARAAGRAMAAEREFAFKIKGVALSQIDPASAFSYYVLDRRETAHRPWLSNEYLRYDPVLSYLEKGQKPPMKAKIPYQQMGVPVAVPPKDYVQKPAFELPEDVAELTKDLKNVDKLNSGLAKSLEALKSKLQQKQRDVQNGSSEENSDKKTEGNEASNPKDSTGKAHESKSEGKSSRSEEALRKKGLGNRREKNDGKYGSGTLAPNQPRSNRAEGSGWATSPWLSGHVNYGLGRGSEDTRVETTFSPSELELLNEKVWRQVPLADRPAKEVQLDLTRQSLTLFTDENKKSHWQLLPALQMHFMSLDETATVANDQDFVMKELADVPKDEDLNLHGQDVRIFYPHASVAVRPEFSEDPALTNSATRRQVLDWFDKSYAKTLNARGAKIDVTQAEPWTRSLAQIIAISPSELRQARANAIAYRELEHYADESIRLGMRFTWHELGHPNQVCGTANNVLKMANDLASDPQAALESIASLDPDSRQRFFKFFVYWNTLGEILSVGNCSGDQALLIKAPLSPLVDYVVKKALTSDKVELIKPQVLSDVSLIPTMDNVPQTPKPQPSNLHPGKMAAKEKTASVAKDQLVLRTETLVGLLVTAPNANINNPYIQLAFAKLWSADAQKFFKVNWWNVREARKNFVQLWQWTPFMNLTDWMSPRLLNVFDRVNAVAGTFVVVGQPAILSYTRVPEIVLPDFLAALNEQKIAFKTSPQPPKIHYSRLKTASDTSLSSVSACFTTVELDSDPMRALESQVQRTGVLPGDFSVSTWRKQKDCSGQAANTYSPNQVLILDLGHADTQTVESMSFRIDVGSSPADLRILIFRKSDPVAQLLHPPGH